MWNYVWVSLGTGILFGVMDGLIHANPLAQRLYAVFKPIARTSVNAAAGIFIDLLYGFVLAGLFLLLHRSLPGNSGWVKGLSYGLILWFLRVLMSVASQWMMYRIPPETLGYMLASGLAEMLLLGIFLGVAVREGA